MSSNRMQDPGLSLPRLDPQKSKFRIFCPDTFVDFCPDLRWPTIFSHNFIRTPHLDLGFLSGPQAFQSN